MTECAWGAVGGAASFCEELPSSTLGGREEVFTRLSCGPRGITGGYRDHSFTRRFHGSNAGAASAVVRPKQRRTTRRSRQAPQSVHVGIQSVRFIAAAHSVKWHTLPVAAWLAKAVRY